MSKGRPAELVAHSDVWGIEEAVVFCILHTGCLRLSMKMTRNNMQQLQTDSMLDGPPPNLLKLCT